MHESPRRYLLEAELPLMPHSMASHNGAAHPIRHGMPRGVMQTSYSCSVAHLAFSPAGGASLCRDDRMDLHIR
jgi:hypothetical protein